MPLPLHEKPAPAQENQALQGGPPVNGERQRDEQHELRWITTEPINPGLNCVADLVDFVGEQADDLRAVRIGQVARPEPERLAVQSSPHARGDVEGRSRADAFGPPQADAAQARERERDQHEQRRGFCCFRETRRCGDRLAARASPEPGPREIARRPSASPSSPGGHEGRRGFRGIGAVSLGSWRNRAANSGALFDREVRELVRASRADRRSGTGRRAASRG